MNVPHALAHVANDGRLHLLVDHLLETADRAESNARPFASEAWGRLAGLWHDLGKFGKPFQDMIRSATGLDAHLEGVRGRVDHSTAGAVFAQQRLGEKMGLPLAFVIAGHHCGLSDHQSDLKPRLEAKKDLLTPALAGGAPPNITASNPPAPPKFLQQRTGQAKEEVVRSWEFWVRMLYSALVDADFLDTEAFFEGGIPPHRSARATLNQLLVAFDDYMEQKLRKAQYGSPPGKVNQVREKVLQACRDRATDPPGVFSLTAPTGAGKTLAAMGFALVHAVRHNRQRVIVVIPFTSIIEQNAQQYRDVFGAENVVEHHASLDPAKETPNNRLACENWDAPIIVTTSVQFLESLLANRSSRCRKLHNIVGSVVIFDEVQSLPIGHLLPILDVLKELVRNYGVSLVLSTATQPALKMRPGGMGSKSPGFETIAEIVPDLPQTFIDMKRVEVSWPPSLDKSIAWEELATEITQEPRALAVVHRRDDARTLARLIPGAFHLSALMCAAHRSQVLRRVKLLLKRTKDPVQLISTQLIEAGVDVDFPVVYRALGGLDAIAQAAGRCNREGRLTMGHVRIFVAPTQPPRGTPRQALAVAKSLLAENPQHDPLRPDIFDRFFRMLYFTHNMDAVGIQREREAWNFETVAKKFQLIEDDGSEPVVVLYGDAHRRLTDLRNCGPSRDRLRALQPFVVNLYPQQVQALERAGALETVADTVKALFVTHAHLYDKVFGLVLEGPLAYDPSALNV